MENDKQAAGAHKFPLKLGVA